MKEGVSSREGSRHDIRVYTARLFSVPDSVVSGNDTRHATELLFLSGFVVLAAFGVRVTDRQIAVKQLDDGIFSSKMGNKVSVRQVSGM